MIAFLQGTIREKQERSIILLAGDVGYLVHLNNNSLSTIKEGQEVSFHIHSQIREDAFDLYGFEKTSDMAFFKQLLNINGIGPKVGMEICNQNPDKIKAAIVEENIDYICSIPGIGKKTAQRIVLELKGKIELGDISTLGSAPSSNVNDDVIQALINLGYQRKHVTKTLKNLPENLEKEEEIITYFLKNA